MFYDNVKAALNSCGLIHPLVVYEWGCIKGGNRRTITTVFDATTMLDEFKYQCEFYNDKDWRPRLIGIVEFGWTEVQLIDGWAETMNEGTNPVIEIRGESHV